VEGSAHITIHGFKWEKKGQLSRSRIRALTGGMGGEWDGLRGAAVKKGS